MPIFLLVHINYKEKKNYKSNGIYDECYPTNTKIAYIIPGMYPSNVNTRSIQNSTCNISKINLIIYYYWSFLKSITIRTISMKKKESNKEKIYTPQP